MSVSPIQLRQMQRYISEKRKSLAYFEIIAENAQKDADSVRQELAKLEAEFALMAQG